MYILIKKDGHQQLEAIVCSLSAEFLEDYVDELDFKSNEIRVFRYADEWEDKETWVGNNLPKKQSQERKFYFLLAPSASNATAWYEHTITYSIIEVEEI